MQQIGEIAKKHAYTNKQGEKQDHAIPYNMEKYMAFMLGKHLKFIDSFQFMSKSLDKLVSNLQKKDLKHTSEMFTGDKLSLMSQKGVYPYDAPTKELFYSVLNDQHITNGEYDHARKVWETFNLKNIGEYHDLYLKSDALLLADVFESFKKTCFQYHKLDPCHYFPSPGLRWDAMLKMTNIELELMTCSDSLKKGSEEESATLQIDMGRLITSTLKNMMRMRPQSISYILCILTPSTFTAGQ